MNSADTVWTLISAALVLLMTPGVAFFYAGLVRRKNAAATIMHCITAIGLVGVVWVLWGYTLAFGPSVGGLIHITYIALVDARPKMRITQKSLGHLDQHIRELELAGQQLLARKQLLEMNQTWHQGKRR